MICEDHVTFNFNLNVTPRGKSRWHPLDRAVGWPQSRRRENLLPLPEIKAWTVTVPNEL
jgi:hypothetical protein